VAILPFRLDGDDKLEYLIRKEVTPCWSLGPVRSAITGGCEDKGPLETAVEELKEEAGYKVSPEQMIPLGQSFASKSADTVYHLFTVNLNGAEQGEATGDGSYLDTTATVEWEKRPWECHDPQLSVMFCRVKVFLMGELE